MLLPDKPNGQDHDPHKQDHQNTIGIGDKRNGIRDRVMVVLLPIIVLVLEGLVVILVATVDCDTIWEDVGACAFACLCVVDVSLFCSRRKKNDVVGRVVGSTGGVDLCGRNKQRRLCNNTTRIRRIS